MGDGTERGDQPSAGGSESTGTVVRATTPAERDAAFSIRHRVFVEEQGVPEARERDGRDGSSVHFLAYWMDVSDTVDGDEDDGERIPVGVARLRRDSSDSAKVERVAVLPTHRGEGWGRRIMAAVETYAREAGYARLVLNAQTPVVGFYETLDYEVVSEAFEEAGIPHRRMEKAL